MTNIKVIVEKHSDGYVACSAIRFHIETLEKEVLQAEPPVLEAFVAEAGVTI